MGRNKAKQRGTFSDKNEGFTIYGIDDFIKKLDNAENAIPVAVPKLFDEVGKPPYNAMYQFMSPGLHYRHHENGTSNTRDFLGTWIKKNRAMTKWNYKVGFELKKGALAGLPALFLDLGTRPHNVTRKIFGGKGPTGDRKVKAPYIKPTYFVYYAFKNSENDMMRASQKAMKEILDEVNR